ncbi:L,D-transpeptidase family protein [Fundicoccus sp. Sow4_F4]|uniref:L,D-transpeptidase family protein n=1 Tax=Fundicoccus sp. Sow4_F4 TaxID=3438783 RepID=UPI003F9183B7
MNTEFIKKHIKYVLPAVGIGIFILLYLLGIWFFQSHFVPNTKVGAISVSQLTLENAQAHVQKELEEQQVMLTENEQELGYIELSQLNVQSDTTAILQQLLEQQSAAKWPVYLFASPQSVEQLDEYVTFDSSMIEGLMVSVGVNNNERTASADAYIGISEAGVYQIKEEVYGQQISATSFESALEKQLENGKNSLDLASAYIQPLVRQDTAEVTDLQARLDKMQNVAITLKLDGESIVIPSDEIASWIFVDESQEPQVNVELIEDYLYGLNETYASLFKTRQFESTYQGTVTLEPGTYGWYIDRYTEAENIAANVLAGEDATREPAIGGSGYGVDISDDIGASYVEVDVYHQMMTIYIEGEVALQTAIVTGTPGTNTVPGTYQVWNMEEESTLVGYNPRTEMDYEQPVDYWIAFDDQAQGIHDANWQSSFGGEAYLSNGSLGCINTPPGVMPDVFELVYYGMPVVIF